MLSPYFIEEKKHIVTSGSMPSLYCALNDRAELTREDRFMLEKHCQDIFRMLLAEIIEIDTVASVGPERTAKARRLLEEYLETKALLERD